MEVSFSVSFHFHVFTPPEPRPTWPAVSWEPSWVLSLGWLEPSSVWSQASREPSSDWPGISMSLILCGSKKVTLKKAPMPDIILIPYHNKNFADNICSFQGCPEAGRGYQAGRSDRPERGHRRQDQAPGWILRQLQRQIFYRRRGTQDLVQLLHKINHRRLS